jgi:hypothetical protein
MTNKPTVKLLGRDGNAYAIIGACVAAAKKAGWTPDKISELKAEMTSGDYNHLLRTAMEHFEVL